MPCRLEKSRQWAIRIMHEAHMHKDSCFVTLTYEKEPLYGSLNKADLQNFFKRLRKRGFQVRYFACGEYGDRFGRCHYHAIIFGLDPETARSVLPSIWGHGFIQTKFLSFESAQYVARYVTKKLTGSASQSYAVDNLTPEFALMSRRPGIGSTYFDKYIKNDSKDYIWVRDKKSGLPRFYSDKKFSPLQRHLKNVSEGRDEIRRKELMLEATRDGKYVSDIVEERNRQMDLNLVGQLQNKGV